MMLGTSFLGGSSGSAGMSREFFDLVKGIGESRSKQEEDRIIVQEVQRLKAGLQDPDSKSRVKEYLIRALYAEMLGHDASFAHIHAVNLVSDKNIIAKRTGYMLCGLCLHPNHEFLLLLVNTIQKDLASVDYLEVAVALTSCAQVIQAEAVPILLPLIVKLLSHSKELIRKKALSALLALYRIDKSILSEIATEVRRVLHDSDLGVVSAALDLIGDIIKRRHFDDEAKNFFESFDGLIPSMVSILKDILSHKLPREWDFHRVPAPWLQIKILNLMVVAVGTDQKNSEEIYEILRAVISRCDLQVNISYAIMYECVRTIASIYPQPSLCELAAVSTARLLESDNKNLQLAGIQGLRELVKLDQSYIAPHQLSIIDCLDDKDETLRTKTLQLLTLTTNSSNVVAVVERLLSSANLYVDVASKRDIIQRAIELIERYAPDHSWYLETTTHLFRNFSQFVPMEAAYDLIRLVATGPTGDEDDDNEFRKEAVRKMMLVAEKLSIVRADSAIRAVFWILGSFASLIPDEFSREEILDLFLETLNSTRIYDHPDTPSWIVGAALKHSAQMIEAEIIHTHTLEEAKAILRQDTPTQFPWLQDIKSLLLCDTASSKSGFDFERRQLAKEFLRGLDEPQTLKDMILVNPYIEDMRGDDYEAILTRFVTASGISVNATKFRPMTRTPIIQLPKAPEVIVPRRESALKFKPYEEQSKEEPLISTVTITESVENLIGDEDEFKVAGKGGRWRQPTQVTHPATQPMAQPTPPTWSREVSSTSGVVQSPDVSVKQLDEAMEQKKKLADQLFAGLPNNKTRRVTQPSVSPPQSHRSLERKVSVKKTNLLEMSDDESSQSTTMDVKGSVTGLPGVRALKVTAEELSHSWQSAETEVKSSKTLPPCSVNKLVEVLTSLNFHVVQVIGHEGLCAAISTNSSTRFYLYFKLDEVLLDETSLSLHLRTDLSEQAAKKTLEELIRHIGGSL
eukprot:Blabericola_migrator_1__32@NODE_1009_length_5717_cov_122_400531_g692_i0_p1_GENE_NODE_1009_length_5717_cov_122_400531_g692_i0NODE_1009_length_5717_cov_122_400531_g692_i0_p1_ORF_typecomplete_len969_score283_85Adaptin_N/PF01602_20/3_2e101AP4E_app_platf/PF14807_6/4_4e08Cnd1/PF12717_7/0_0022Cnd1/PF12717_7/2_6Arm_2/PF04826_13/0_44Arm_2/PF04826_13/2_2Cnd3/PF12719_7/0_0097HEAT_EZ/PF13513_6/1_1e04HEAT_EZ/PF13513_6/0_085HEAT_EZ/PF13513_6/3_4e03HEAT_EZ/PF13513_6/2_2e02CLASP_N/PF12348_8/6_5e03CLASP_N/PF1234